MTIYDDHTYFSSQKMRDLIESMMESLEDDPKNPQDSKEK